MNKLTLILTAILFFPFLTATGLAIEGSSSWVINKTFDKDINILIKVKNPETFSFYNISFENNNIIRMTKISELKSGQTAKFNATIYGNKNFDGDVLIKGFYKANLGAPNDFYEVDVDFYEGLSKCDFSIIEGDTVKWNNLVPDEIRMKNAQTGEDVTTIFQNQSYQTTFEQAQTFEYYFIRRGFSFTDLCTITVLDKEGMINNPEYDTLIHLKVNLEYEPTTISASLPVSNYTMDYDKTQDGIISIENTGNKTAKDIHLSGAWFSFSDNDFELEPGYTKIVTYTIQPYITETNQTDKEYLKNITISGNFDNINKQIKIFINYAKVTSNYLGTGEDFMEVFRNLYDAYCDNNPDENICLAGENVVYTNPNQLQLNMSKEMWQYLFEIFDYIKEKEKHQSVELNNQTSFINHIMNSTLQNTVANLNTKEDIEELHDVMLFGYVFAFTFVVSIMLLALIFYYRKRKIMEEFDKY